MTTKKLYRGICLALSGLAATPLALAQDAPAVEEMVVTSQLRTFASSSVSEEMLNQVSGASSVLGAIDYIPGVLVNEGDAFDTENLFAVGVVQGTSDIASWSHEALGGSMNFRSVDPTQEAGLTASTTVGDNSARKVFVRYNTGEVLDNTFVWVSMSTSDIDSWIDASGESNRDHMAAKLKGYYDNFELSGYISYDDAHEDNYQRITPQEFIEDPTWDRLTGNWTGTPHVDQLYRRAWSTLRKNLLAYANADFEVSGIDFSTSVYHHDNSGRGDWIPPYIVDVRNDGAGSPHSELLWVL